MASLYVEIFRNITPMLNNILLYCACIMYAMNLTPVDHNQRRHENAQGQKIHTYKHRSSHVYAVYNKTPQIKITADVLSTVLTAVL